MGDEEAAPLHPFRTVRASCPPCRTHRAALAKRVLEATCQPEKQPQLYTQASRAIFFSSMELNASNT